MKAFKLLVVAALFSALSTGLDAEEVKTQTEKGASEIRIADLNIINVPIDQAVVKVTDLSKEGDPAKKGVTILLDKGIDPAKVKPINLTLKDVPVIDVIRVIAALSGLEPRYEEKVVILVPAKPAP